MEIFFALIFILIFSAIFYRLIYKVAKSKDPFDTTFYSNSQYRSDLAKQKRSEAEDFSTDKKRVWNPQKKNYDPNTLGAFTGDPDAPSASDLFPTKDKKKKKEPEIKKGKRGGRYTEDKTKDGRPYRRYF